VLSSSLVPLGKIATALSPDQRRAYAAQVAAEQDALAREVVALGGTVLARFTYASSGIAAVLDPAAVVRLARSSRVTRIRPIGSYQMDLNFTVPSVGGAAVQARGLSGRGATIAVIDSGIDYTHLAFGGPGTAEAYAEAYATNTTIGDNAFFPGPRVKGGFDYVGELWPDGPLAPDPDPIDSFGHGTSVADIAAGSTPGAPGMAPAADLYAFKACSARSRLCNGLALLQAVDDALDLDNDLATLDPATVIVLAISSAYGQPEDDLSAYVDIAAEMGSVVVASAGSSGNKPYIVGAPGTADGAISVGASARVSSSLPLLTASANLESSRGPHLADGAIKPDLLAPAGSSAAAVGTGNGTRPFGGSSSAVPVVAGAAALLFEKFGPQLSPAGYRALLMNHALTEVVTLASTPTDGEAVVGLRGADALNLALRSTDRGLAPRVFVRCADGSPAETLDALADTFVQEPRPRTAYGNLSELRIRAPEKTPPGERFALLRFPSPACAVASAHLQLEIFRIVTTPSFGPMQAYEVSGGWNEATTWATRPALGALVASTNVSGTGVYTLDVSSLAGSGGASWDVAVRTAERLSVILYSREVRAAPRLLVDCVDGQAELLDPRLDTYVREDQPNTSFGNSSALRISAEPGKRRYSLLRFPTPTCSVADARLQLDAVGLFTIDEVRRGGPLEATRVLGEWSDTSTWATRPELGERLDSQTITRTGRVDLRVVGLFVAASVLAPITSMGAGQVDVLRALDAETLAWQDVIADSDATLSETASLSFGYQAVSTSYSETRQVRVRNLSTTTRLLSAQASFRFGDDVERGVRLRLTPPQLSLPAGGEAVFSLTLEIDAAGLRPWLLNSGALGAAGGLGTDVLSPSLTLYEYDGLIEIRSQEPGDTRPPAQIRPISLPWQVLPKRVADLRTDTAERVLAPGATDVITVQNVAPVQVGEVDVFALTELSPNIYSYTVGSAVGENQSPSDLKEVGVRGRMASDGTQFVEFAATVYDQPFRAAQYPVRMEVLIDTDQDGFDDALVYTDDRSGGVGPLDGRSAVFVRRPVSAPPVFVGYVDRDFNSQNWILPAPAAALGILPDAPFIFQVRAVDNIFPPAPGTVVYDRTSRMTFQLDRPAFQANSRLSVAPGSLAELAVGADTEGLEVSASQQGLLLLYRQAPPGRESAAIPLTTPSAYPPPLN
jgi:subtilisin family serine protease